MQSTTRTDSRPRPPGPRPDLRLKVGHIACWLLLASAGLTGMSSQAAINACRSDDGTVVFQDQPCAQTNTTRHTTTRVDRDERPPAGMHESWFERPEAATSEASCDRLGCRCGALARSFDGGLELAVADALYLDGAWHRHETEVAALTNASSSASDAAIQQARPDIAACEVMMAQATLRKHMRTVITRLHRQAREAEERGFDDPAECNAGDPVACEYLDAMALYQRMQGDVKALQLSRHLELDALSATPEQRAEDSQPSARLPALKRLR